jgi:hypothetical protein
VAIFHQAIIAKDANINHKNIVQLSHIKIFSLTSKNQKGINTHTRIIEICIIKTEFFNNSLLSSLLNKITQSTNKIKKEIIDNQEVLPEIQSVQFIALKIKTYQIIVKIRGIIYMI